MSHFIIIIYFEYITFFQSKLGLNNNNNNLLFIHTLHNFTNLRRCEPCHFDRARTFAVLNICPRVDNL